MTDPTFLRTNQTDETDYSFRGSQTFGTEHSKTYALLKQQDKFISKFENNLQKTLELIHVQPNKEIPQSPYSKDQETRDRISSIGDSRFRESVHNSGQKENIPTHQDSSKLSDLRFSTLKDPRDRNFYSNDPTSRLRASSSRRNEELITENEHLKVEMNRQRADSFRKYEQLKKNNDELLLSYEERFKISTKHLTEQHENEVSDLKAEIGQLREENRKLRENMRSQKDKYKNDGNLLTTNQ